jgi:conjugal transfer pilus assembly protein TraK
MRLISALIAILLTSSVFADPVVNDKAPEKAVDSGVKLKSSSAAMSASAPSINDFVKSPPAKTPKQTTAKYPGMGVVLGNASLMKANIVRMTGDGTEIVPISGIFQNRIATPFANPRVIDTSTAGYKTDGSNIFVLPADTQPFVIYVTGSDAGDPVLSMTLIPKNIPAQTVILQLDPSMTDKPKQVNKPSSYTEQLKAMMTMVVSGRAPEGFSESVVPNTVGKIRDIAIVPLTRYSGSNTDIYVYEMENQGKENIELSESSFYQKGVLAIGIYPSAKLAPAAHSKIYIISKKSALEDGEAISE